MPGHLEPAPVAPQLGALGLAGLDRGEHAVARGAGHERAHLAALLGAGPDPHGVDARLERLGERVAGGADRDDR